MGSFCLAKLAQNVQHFITDFDPGIGILLPECYFNDRSGYWVLKYFFSSEIGYSKGFAA